MFLSACRFLPVSRLSCLSQFRLARLPLNVPSQCFPVCPLSFLPICLVIAPGGGAPKMFPMAASPFSPTATAAAPPARLLPSPPCKNTLPGLLARAKPQPLRLRRSGAPPTPGLSSLVPHAPVCNHTVPYYLYNPCHLPTSVLLFHYARSA